MTTSHLTIDTDAESVTKRTSAILAAIPSDCALSEIQRAYILDQSAVFQEDLGVFIRHFLNPLIAVKTKYVKVDNQVPFTDLFEKICTGYAEKGALTDLAYTPCPNSDDWTEYSILRPRGMISRHRMVADISAMGYQPANFHESLSVLSEFQIQDFFAGTRFIIFGTKKKPLSLNRTFESYPILTVTSCGEISLSTTGFGTVLNCRDFVIVRR